MDDNKWNSNGALESPHQAKKPLMILGIKIAARGSQTGGYC